jgi:serine/threonine-protein kinase
VAISALVLGVLGDPARAQSAAAETLFADGERLLKDGKVAAACDAFEASNRIEARAGTLINLGLCRERNHQLASAWSAFKDALSRAKDPKKQQIAGQHVASIEPRLSYLTISVSDESRIDALTVTRNGSMVDPALWNRAIPVDAGTYTISGKAPGHEEWSTTVEVPIELGKVSVEVPRFKELVKLAPPPPDPEPSPNDSATDVVTRSPGMFTPKRTIAVGLAGAGVVAVGAAVVLGIQAKGFRNDAYALCSDPAVPCARGDEANALMDRGRSRATGANIAYGVGAAAVIGAAVLWFVGAPEDSEKRVSITPQARGLRLTVSF